MSSAPLEKSAVEPMTVNPPIREPGHVDVEYRWQGNNRVELLENGEEYFPRVFEAMRAAKSEILLETFIVFEDKVGAELQEILIDAARRGVRTTVSLDGFGCGELSTGYLTALSEAGVHLQIFDPAPKRLGIRTNWFRRLHRKILVIDGTLEVWVERSEAHKALSTLVRGAGQPDVTFVTYGGMLPVVELVGMTLVAEGLGYMSRVRWLISGPRENQLCQPKKEQEVVNKI